MYIKVLKIRYVFMPPKAYTRTLINQTMAVLPTDGIRLLTVATFFMVPILINLKNIFFGI